MLVFRECRSRLQLQFTYNTWLVMLVLRSNGGVIRLVTLRIPLGQVVTMHCMVAAQCPRLEFAVPVSAGIKNAYDQKTLREYCM
jgi:hypothetical protein